MSARPRHHLLFAAFVLLAMIWLLPLGFVAFTALRSQRDIIAHGVFAAGNGVEWSNFATAWQIGRFRNLFANSTLLILIKVPLGIFLSSLAAYALATMRFRLNWVVFGLFLLGLAIPVHVTLLPLALLLKRIGMNDSLLSLLPPYVALGLPFQTLVLAGFFRTIPSELMDAADLDGCGAFARYWHVAMPLAKPAWITLGIIDIVGTWNELLIALVLIGSERWQTVPMGLLQFQGQFSSRYPVVMAAVLIAIAPVMTVYILFQKYLATEMTAGALKE